MLFIYYKKCSTCRNAKSFLDNHHIKYEERDITLENPTKEELKEWISKYNLDINKLFNTSGLVYRELNLKDKIKNMSFDEKLLALSQNGMLVKRPILIMDDKILIGYKENDYSKNLCK